MKDEEVWKLLSWKKSERPFLTRDGLGVMYRCEFTEEVKKIYEENYEQFRRNWITPREYPSGSGKLWLMRMGTFETGDLEKSRATDAQIEIPMPAGVKLFGYQKAGVSFMSERTAGLFGDEMGLGKTVQFIALLNWLNRDEMDYKRILIVTTKLTVPNWIGELKRFCVRSYSISEHFNERANIIICPHSSAWKWSQKGYLKECWDLICIDEAHYLKGETSQRKLAIYGGKDEDGNKYNGVIGRRKYCLTGTPGSNRPRDIYSTASWLDPEIWKNRFLFERRYCAGGKGVSNAAELQTILRCTIMVRREKSQVLKELPPIRRSVVVFDRPEHMKSLQQELRAEGAPVATWAKKVALAKARMELAKIWGGSDYSNAVKKLTETIQAGEAASSELRQKVIQAKLPLIEEWYKDAIEEEGVKRIVFGYHREPLQKLQQKIGGALIIGGQNANKNFEMIQKFQEDPSYGPVFMSIAIAQGINLTAAKNVEFIEGSWIPSEISQAEMRAHRPGQKNSVMVRHLVMEGTIDQVMAQVVTEKQNQLDECLSIDHRNGESIEEREPIIPMAGITITRKKLLEVSVPVEEREKLKEHCRRIEAAGREGSGVHLPDAYLAFLLNDKLRGIWPDPAYGLASLLAKAYPAI